MNKIKVAALAVIGGALLFTVGKLFATSYFLTIVDELTKDKECDIAAPSREFSYKPYYAGPLIDAHVHMPVSSRIVSAVAKRFGFEGTTAFGGSLTIDYLNCLFKSEGIIKTFGFFMPTWVSSGAEVRTVKKAEKAYPELFAPFWMPVPISAVGVGPSDVRKILDKNNGLFKGIGELKSFGDLGDIDSPNFLEMYKIASDYNLIIMLHPYNHHKQAVEKILKDHPKVKFLLHGGEKDIEKWIVGIMKNYSNVYYSLDGDIVNLYGSKDREYAHEDPTKEEFLAYVRENFDSLLDEKIRDWKTRIETHPDRFMWGTDRWYEWHFDYEVGGLIEEYGRTFIGKLDPSVREKFAYKNAQKLLENSGKK